MALRNHSICVNCFIWLYVFISVLGMLPICFCAQKHAPGRYRCGDWWVGIVLDLSFLYWNEKVETTQDWLWWNIKKRRRYWFYWFSSSTSPTQRSRVIGIGMRCRTMIYIQELCIHIGRLASQSDWEEPVPYTTIVCLRPLIYNTTERKSVAIKRSAKGLRGGRGCKSEWWEMV